MACSKVSLAEDFSIMYHRKVQKKNGGNSAVSGNFVRRNFLPVRALMFVLTRDEFISFSKIPA
jgi:hypothetical protein